MWGILGSFRRFLFPWARLHSEKPLPVFLASWLQTNRERGAQAQPSWCHGMRSGTHDWNKEGGEMENLEKGNYKKTHHVIRLPHVSHVQVFPFTGGSRAVGWLLVVLYWNPKSISEGWSPLWGCSFLCWVHSEIFLHDIQVMISCKEGLPSRWDELTWDPKPSGFSTAVQTEALPADYGSFPKWLSSGVWKNSLGLEKGRGQLTQSNCGKGQYEEWISPARRKVFGFPRSMGRHRSWYSKCLLHCTSLWKKIVCWKVSKQTLY